MTTSTPAGRTPVHLYEPAQLLAALPYLIGFRPANSLVVLCHRAPEADRVGLLLRGDIPRREDWARQARALSPRLAPDRFTGVTVLVVGGERRPGGPPPHAGFVEELANTVADVGLPMLHALWAADIAEGAPWGCYTAPQCRGVLPDPRTTVVAAMATEHGKVVFDSREELAALLEPRCPEALARRTAELTRQPGLPWPDETRVSDASLVIREAFERQRCGAGPPTDEQAVLLAAALTIPEIRDVCLATAASPGTPAALEAERLWLTLVQELPIPERAEAAALLGYTAYLRGDGALAGMALDNALAANPNHALAGLLKRVLCSGTSPQELLGLALAADPMGSSGFGLITPNYVELDMCLSVEIRCGRSMTGKT
ncbi:DUF4192 domain-containing protein [Amycolatopsis sp. OK19-0408]|uniref:DUF4192 domain-containing protein n=1 Tax=Amycolatopsis iheyensis TaxID=2945988 RepID=A0A9X2NKL2_9PSEU|nr:DUF4192 domain-containing protein [Amycolatopsis iheyensis]MCR6490424.1 DUF4192 domain-containing protein [Amycolatopsis iheyensis]